MKHGTLAKKLRNSNSEEEKKILTEQLRAIEQERIHIPYADPFDEGFKRIQYVRYADDFLVGVIGSKEDAREIKERVRAFLADTLKLGQQCAFRDYPPLGVDSGRADR